MGTLHRVLCNKFNSGITPTYMGNTMREDYTRYSELVSPPHTWGIHCWRPAKRIRCGITPTYMGNTSMLVKHYSATKDHPPYTWGTRTHICPGIAPFRITPIYMGNTPAVTAAVFKAWDHPHIHGEYESPNCNRTSIRGSPPHTWGILVKS